ncbi:hypothetical protein NEOLI_000150 [Neolecta irregularis DAH-3]|uniref:SUN-like protein 1 n=1 Tax=Neolecta irregularis (strain DAH-3) TaxID=1198029 RepID=A0A1U7LQX8_NEOID|nr:hypothetical protein NEOLI_000150 [Neolecta irregularis DAH-3]|eukprot:OLL25044.1 hypothetical protein NEOLI_000150 [Neolecta irregularis DAH-3]
MRWLLWTLAIQLCQCLSIGLDVCLNPAFFAWLEVGNDTCPSSVDKIFPPALKEPLLALDDDPASQFLSFDEWKRKISAQSPQQADSYDHRQPTNDQGQIMDELANDINKSINLESLDDSTRHLSPRKTISSPQQATNTELEELQPISRKAGETSKQRFNYASFDCAATILKANPESKGSNSILVEIKDSYMLNECSAPDKFVIIELCDHILLDTVVIANFEFFSSMIRDFRVLVSDRYPTATWTLLDTFQARNAREIQAFAIHNPQIWAKFLRIEFISQYGTEFFCPISLLRVHGTTMMEEYRLQEDPEKFNEEAVHIVDDTTQVTATSSLPDESSVKSGISNQTTELPDDNKHVQTDNDNIMFSPYRARDTPDYSPTPESSPQRYDLVEYSGESSCPASGRVPKSRQFQFAEISTSQVLLISPLTSSVTIPAPTAQPEIERIMVTAPLQTQTSRIASETASQISPMPSTQESFYKAISKRLGNLETNATLSLQYIEDQSRMLRDVFNQMEKKHADKIYKIVDHLNATVLPQISLFRTQYNQLFRETMSELNIQREMHEREWTAMNARMTVLANEVIRQKRVGIAQSILLLTILAFVMITRGAGHEIIQIPSLKRLVSSTILSRSESSERSIKSPSTPTLDIFDRIRKSQKHRWSAPAEKWDVPRAVSESSTIERRESSPSSPIIRSPSESITPYCTDQDSPYPDRVGLAKNTGYSMPNEKESTMY